MIAQLPFAVGDAPELHSGRCVNRRHGGAQCSRCVEACPVQAIALHGQEPQLDESACVRCGLCLHVCPTDVYTPALDFERRLGQTVANLPLEPLALVCAAHPAPAITTSKVTAVVQHRRCLAGLSPADLLELSAGGRRALWLDDSPCTECVIGSAQAALQGSADSARALLHAAGRPPAILLHSERPPAADARAVRVPLFDGAQPAISRRSFLSRFRPSQAEQTEIEEVAYVEDWIQRGAPVSTRLPQQVPEGQRKLLAALGHLESAQAGEFATAQSPFAAVQVDTNLCSACGLCARFCPTGALHFTAQDGVFDLSFQPAACVDCGVCAAACPEHAILLGESMDLGAILADDIVPLAAGELVRCSVCGAPTAQTTGVPMVRCHVCRQGAGVVTSLRDHAGLMDDLLKRIPK
jgi:ferredoxin